MPSSAVICSNKTTQKNTNAQYIEKIEVTEEKMNVFQLVLSPKIKLLRLRKFDI